MCATPKIFSQKSVKSSDKKIAPSASDLAADNATEAELRRLRSLYGRRATILTPDSAALGQAPTKQKNLLGS